MRPVPEPTLGRPESVKVLETEKSLKLQIQAQKTENLESDPPGSSKKMSTEKRIMNTKFVEPIYEAAHCLYASRLDIIKDGNWMDTNYPPKPRLFLVDEFETFDIDYEWQFKLGEKLYENL